MSLDSGVVRAIGLMSGTSMDGVDVALLETDGESRLAFGPTAFAPYSESDRTALRAALARAAEVGRREDDGPIARAADIVVARHVEAVERFLTVNRIDRTAIELIGFHGQTVLHRPAAGVTLQIGDGARLAERLAVPVVFDFRSADVRAGGQGAPLVPVFHRALVEAAGLRKPVALLNVGGVANITIVPPAGDPIACDAGPGNALLDDLMRERTGAAFDRDGATAARGVVREDLLGRLMSARYFAEPPPKSLDRNQFSMAVLDDAPLEDAAATLVAFTAEAVGAALRLCGGGVGRLIVCGGGARNPTLVAALRNRLSCIVQTADEYGWSADFIEAQAFACLAVRSVRGLPLTFPTTTGVQHATSGGVLATPAGRGPA